MSELVNYMCNKKYDASSARKDAELANELPRIISRIKHAASEGRYGVGIDKPVLKHVVDELTSRGFYVGKTKGDVCWVYWNEQ